MDLPASRRSRVTVASNSFCHVHLDTRQRSAAQVPPRYFIPRILTTPRQRRSAPYSSTVSWSGVTREPCFCSTGTTSSFPAIRLAACWCAALILLANILSGAGSVSSAGAEGRSFVCNSSCMRVGCGERHREFFFWMKSNHLAGMGLLLSVQKKATRSVAGPPPDRRGRLGGHRSASKMVGGRTVAVLRRKSLNFIVNHLRR